MTPAFSALSIPAIRFMLTSTIDSLDADPAASAEDHEIQHQAAVEALEALKPRDANEANLAAQAVVAHHVAMACFRRAAQPGLPDTVVMRILGRALAFSRLAGRMQTALRRSQSAGKPRTQPAPSPKTALAPAAVAPQTARAEAPPEPTVTPPSMAGHPPRAPEPAGGNASFVPSAQSGPALSTGAPRAGLMPRHPSTTTVQPVPRRATA
jgi:hypothetical protein